jgi:hypothetical protein
MTGCFGGEKSTVTNAFTLPPLAVVAVETGLRSCSEAYVGLQAD